MTQALAALLVAAQFSSTQPAVCGQFDRFYDAVCSGGGYPTAAQQDASLAKGDVGAEAQRLAMAEAAAACDPSAGCPASQFDDAYAVAYASETERLALAKLGVTREEFLALAGFVKDALAKAADGQTGLSAQAKQRFKRIVGYDRVLLPSQFLREPSLSPADARQALASVCGGSGLVTNAFADKGVGAMVFCPGYLIDTATAFANLLPAERLAAMEIVVAHELAHTIDNNTLSVAASYGPMASCLRTVASASPNLFPNGLDQKFGELAADFWAVEAFRFRHPAADVQSFEALKRGLRLFCDSPENPEHPSGAARIELAARNPDLRTFFGCRAVDAERPACSWQGQVR